MLKAVSVPVMTAIFQHTSYACAMRSAIFYHEGVFYVTTYLISILRQGQPCLLGAIEKLGWKLDRIIHVEIWATNDIPADLPQMVEFKAKADKIIKDRWGIEVEHLRADSTYEDLFYSKHQKGKMVGEIYGFPMIKGTWCTSRLKSRILGAAESERETGFVCWHRC